MAALEQVADRPGAEEDVARPAACRPLPDGTAACPELTTGVAKPPLARVGETCRCGGTIGPDGMCDRCRARAQADAPGGGSLSPNAMLALQRSAGNRAVAAMLQRQAVTKRAATNVLQRSNGPHEGEDAGCGFCMDPAVAGVIAHGLVQTRMGSLGVDNELRVAAGDGPGGRLDLGRWNETTIEIGEIKPGHDEGMALGKRDLDFYEDRLRKSKDPKFKDKEVRRLSESPPAPIEFPNAGVQLPDKQMMKTKLDSGVYGYWCDPSARTYFVGAQLVLKDKGTKKVTPAQVKASEAFFNSDCIREKSKRRPEQVERARVTDRAGAVRFAPLPLALAMLQSRAYHLRHDLEMLAGEHRVAHQQWQRAILEGGLFGGLAIPGAIAALWTGMPDVAMWSRAEAAAAKTRVAPAADAKVGAADLKTFGEALSELEEAIVAPKYEFLAWKARRDGTPPPRAAHETPAPVAGAQPPGVAPPPIPPPSAQAGTATGSPAGGAEHAESGVGAVEIAALAALVVVTFLLLPEVAVAGAAAEVAGVATAGEVAMTGGAALGAETALEAAAYEFAVEASFEAGGAAAAAL